MLLDMPKAGDWCRWLPSSISKAVAVWELQAVGVPRYRPKRVFVCNWSLSVAASVASSTKRTLHSKLVDKNSSYWHCDDGLSVCSAISRGLHCGVSGLGRT